MKDLFLLSRILPPYWKVLVFWQKDLLKVCPSNFIAFNWKHVFGYVIPYDSDKHLYLVMALFLWLSEQFFKLNSKISIFEESYSMVSTFSISPNVCLCNKILLALFRSTNTLFLLSLFRNWIFVSFLATKCSLIWC